MAKRASSRKARPVARSTRPPAKKVQAATTPPKAAAPRSGKTAAAIAPTGKKGRIGSTSVFGPRIPPSKAGFTKSEVVEFRKFLMRLREQTAERINFLADGSLHYVDDTPAEDRTDDFDREFALAVAGSEQDMIFEIDDALRRTEMGTYGQCDECGCPIEKKRLKALPFARMCMKCQSAVERGRTRYRPFGETLEQTAEPAAESAETEEAE